MPLPVAFSTLACPHWTWDDVLDRGTEYGYDGVEIRLLRNETNLLSLDEFAPSERAARRADLADRSFRVCGLGSSVRFDLPERAEQEQHLENCRAYLELARDLGAEFVRVFGDTLPADADAEARRKILVRMAADIRSLSATAEECGVQILIETHGDFADSAQMVELISRVASTHVGVLWDTHHPWRFYGESLEDTFTRLQPWVRHTHWKDSVRRPEKQLSQDEQAAEQRASQLMSGHKPADYVLFGGGEFPVRECMQLLQVAGYTGWCSLEWEKAWHPEIEDPDVALPLFPPKIRAAMADCAPNKS